MCLACLGSQQEAMSQKGSSARLAGHYMLEDRDPPAEKELSFNFKNKINPSPSQSPFHPVCLLLSKSSFIGIIYGMLFHMVTYMTYNAWKGEVWMKMAWPHTIFASHRQQHK